MLLYLVKHSQINLTNSARKLLKAGHGANPAAHKELIDVIKYVLETKNLGLKITFMLNSKEPWESSVFMTAAIQETQ